MSPDDIKMFRQIIREEVGALLAARNTSPSPIPSSSGNASYELRAMAFREALRRSSEKLSRKRLS
ncbi:MAG: hypothetical protein JJE30_14680 [Desulfuromonadales bacterium]|nr:hypothetical protein [Desulfuromonadales bacterium]